MDAKKLEKIRKLLAMGKDTRGNSHEAETAMRQANKLMAELGIEEAEVNMAALDKNTMIFGETLVHPEGKDLASAPRPKTGSTKWCGVLGLGVAVFCDTVMSDTHSPTHGRLFKFQGEKEDVLFAAWLFKLLAQNVNEELRNVEWDDPSHARSKSRRDGFRDACAAVLQRRLNLLRQERTKIHEEAAATSSSRAIVVVNRKAQEIVARFGAQRSKTARSYRGDAAAQGREAGNRIHIPQARPIEHTQTQTPREKIK